MTLKDRLEQLKSRMYRVAHHTVEPTGDTCCPHCGHELEHIDSFSSYGVKIGNIYKCPSVFCESEVFGYHFFDEKGNLDLKEGYPF